MDGCKQLTPGVVVAIFGAFWGTKGQMKVSRCNQVLPSLLDPRFLHLHLWSHHNL